jgi:hypothetical protein
MTNLILNGFKVEEALIAAASVVSIDARQLATGTSKDRRL